MDKATALSLLTNASIFAQSPKSSRLGWQEASDTVPANVSWCPVLAQAWSCTQRSDIGIVLSAPDQWNLRENV